MQHGFLKLAAATVPVRVADCAFNAAGAVRAMDQAAALGAAVLCLPRLGLTGATCGDLFLQQTLLGGAQEALRAVLDASAGKHLLTFVGLPLLTDGRLYDCAAAVLDGQLLGLVPNRAPEEPFAPGPDAVTPLSLLGRQTSFGAAQLFACETLPALVVGCTVGGRLDGPGLFEAALCAAGATLLCHPDASVAQAGADAAREALALARSRQLTCGYLYCAAGEGESTTDFVYSGQRLAAENGELLAKNTPGATLMATELDLELLAHARAADRLAPPAAMARTAFSLPRAQTALTRAVEPAPFFPAALPDPAGYCGEILEIQAAGLSQRLRHTGAKTCVLGLSGGLDSTLALLVCVGAMDRLGRSRQEIRTVTMPCFGTTSRTKNNAGELARLLGVSFETIPIAQAVTLHFRDIGLPPDDRSAAFENAQARERTQVLMDLANRWGGLVVGTGDLSELALGWATYNGDHMSMYAVNASVPKTLIRQVVAAYAAQAGGELAAVLRDVLATPVSPELLPPTDGAIAQKTEDLVGPYELHDFFLYHLLRHGCSPAKLLRLARAAFAGRYPDHVLLHWLRTFCRRFFAQQFKRSCAPDGPAATAVSLSPRAGLRMPSDAAWTLWQAELDALPH